MKRPLPTRILRAAADRLHRWSGSILYPPPCVDPRDCRFNADGLATEHGGGFLDDARFQKAYKAGVATGSWGDADVRWRAHVACWAADNAIKLPGDFVECGVNRGGLSRAVIDYVQWKGDRRFYLVDTYQGLDPRFASPAERRSWEESNRYPDCHQAVLATFGSIPGVEVVKGAVPEVLPRVQPEQVAYLSIDMNCVLPEKAALEHFWPRLVPGAIIVLDDHGWRGHEAQASAHEAFAASVGHSVLALPTGQGLIIKRP